jgi:hypothetical protein
MQDASNAGAIIDAHQVLAGGAARLPPWRGFLIGQP